MHASAARQYFPTTIAPRQTVLRTFHPSQKVPILGQKTPASFSFFQSLVIFLRSTTAAELCTIYFSSMKVLNKSVDNSVQKPTPRIPNFLYSNGLMLFALFQGIRRK